MDKKLSEWDSKDRTAYLYGVLKFDKEAILKNNLTIWNDNVPIYRVPWSLIRITDGVTQYNKYKPCKNCRFRAWVENLENWKFVRCADEMWKLAWWWIYSRNLQFSQSEGLYVQYTIWDSSANGGILELWYKTSITSFLDLQKFWYVGEICTFEMTQLLLISKRYRYEGYSGTHI